MRWNNQALQLCVTVLFYLCNDCRVTNPDHQGAPVTRSGLLDTGVCCALLNLLSCVLLRRSHVCIALWAISSGSPPLIRIPF